MTEQEIINAAVEKALLLIPEVIGNLMAQNATLHRLNSKFYTDHPEFKDKKEVVASVLEMVEGNNPHKGYDELLALAVPEIKKRISHVKDLDMSVPSTVNRHFSNIGNGEI